MVASSARFGAKAHRWVVCTEGGGRVCLTKGGRRTGTGDGERVAVPWWEAGPWSEPQPREEATAGSRLSCVVSRRTTRRLSFVMTTLVASAAIPFADPSELGHLTI